MTSQFPLYDAHTGQYVGECPTGLVTDCYMAGEVFEHNGRLVHRFPKPAGQNMPLDKKAPRVRPLVEVYKEGQIPMEWAVEDLLPMSAITLVVGSPKVGKTTMFLSWLKAMYLTGTDWCGFAVQPAVCWLLTDEGTRSLSRAIEKVGIPVNDEQHHHEVSIISDNDLSWDELCEWISDRIVNMQETVRRASGEWDPPIPPRVILIDTLGHGGNWTM